jgi:hypothetical protein
MRVGALRSSRAGLDAGDVDGMPAPRAKSSGADRRAQPFADIGRVWRADRRRECDPDVRGAAAA